MDKYTVVLKNGIEKTIQSNGMTVVYKPQQDAEGRILTDEKGRYYTTQKLESVTWMAKDKDVCIEFVDPDDISMILRDKSGENK